MTEHYVTLFDSLFLPQGLALHHSLLEHGGDCLLWVLCLDRVCLNTLKRLDLPQIRLLDLQELETPELLSVKPSRTKAEYCWTLTPWSLQWVLESDQTVSRVTYLDADIFFLKSPAAVFNEFAASGRGVLITDHGYAPEYDISPVAGRYCVQFLSLARGKGEPVLHWWRDKCLDWCFARHEDGKFGDQIYLEDFENIYPGSTYSTGTDKRFQAPWNASIFRHSEAIVYHFHGLRIISPYFFVLSNNYSIPGPCIKFVYLRYCRLLVSLCLSHGIDLAPQVRPFKWHHILIHKLKKRIWLQIAPSPIPPFFYSRNDQKGIDCAY